MSQQGLNLIQQRITYKSKVKITLIAMNIGLSALYFGYCLVFFGQIPINVLIQTFDIPLQQPIAKGILNGIALIGSLFGTLLIPILVSKFSRRKCMIIINCFAIIIGGLIYIKSFPVLTFCRLCQGLCCGFSTAVVPIIIKEISPSQLYQTLGSFIQLFLTLGIFISCILSYCLSKVISDQYSWYILFAVPQLIIIFQTVILVFVFPYETPKYLLSVGKQEEAKKLLSIIYKPQFVDQILQEKIKDLQISSQPIKSKLQSLLSDRTDISSLPNSTITIIIAIHLSTLQQFSGISAVSIYGGTIAEVSVSGQLKFLIPSLFNFQQIIAVFFTSVFLNRFGRRTILICGSLFTGITCGMIMIGFFLSPESQFRETVIVSGLFVFGAVYGVTLGPTIWLYIPEIVQPNIVAVAAVTTAISGSIVIILFPIITEKYLNNDPAYLFVFFTAWCLLSSVFNYKYVLETKGKSEKTIRQEYLNLKLC